MYLEIVSPEATLFSSEVDSVIVPGPDGEFQMLNNHAAIVSTLTNGTIKIYTNSQSNANLDDRHALIVPSKDNAKVLTLSITSGTLEMKNNKAIILVD
ncbi:F0F1 ATP synthase subunit epsilon [Sediminibacter sp. Hel_I_10]|uniref:FoF1 ATP synthase subunit delta/epsilon n=1 Tax=Sediminibacter sp. Hel_I_10 TaxID=1392490 RepID=UPI00047DAAA4|nr:F0F1 ATP synthase subunit epsilon [Sediminibacter sp. Hel_I_10]